MSSRHLLRRSAAPPGGRRSGALPDGQYTDPMAWLKDAG